MKTLNEESNNGSSNNTFLGFSLSPQIKMEPPASPAAFYFTPHLNSSGILCYGVEENGNSNSPFSGMEAFGKSQSEGIIQNSSPKLEDFLGGVTMGLSLDSIYYHQNAEQETNRHHSLALLPQQDPSFPFQTNSCCSGLVSQIYQSPLEVENWVNRHFPAPLEQMNNGMVELGRNSGSGSDCAMGSGDLQSLTLSMTPGSQSSCITAPLQISPTATDCSALVGSRKRTAEKVIQKQPVPRKSLDTFGQRTSQYRGVTRHRWTGRYEAHLWDNSCKKEGQTRKGRQVYLGGYDVEAKAARAYDLAALKYWGPSSHINFPLENYRDELEEMKNMNRQEYVAHLRRKSSGFSRGASIYRGVTRHHQHGRWQARIGRVAGNKDLYLGTFSTQEEAGVAYDVAAIKFRGVNAVTNFDITRYDVEKIMASNTLLAGEVARRNKDTESNNEAIEYNTTSQSQPNLGSVESPISNTNCGDSSFSIALQNLMGVDPNEASKKQGTQFSNSSSLGTSISSSSEGSPDKCGSTMVFAKPPLASKFISPTSGVGSWIPSAELRSSSISVAPHLPGFAAWNET